MSETKSVTLAYVFSLIGGLFGLHHLYLGRTQHALLWFTTLGGFGVGWIGEMLFFMKAYVHEANRDRCIMNEYRLKMRQSKSPAFEISRLTVQYLTATFYGFIMFYLFPESWHGKSFASLWIGLCSAVAIAFGTYLTGTVGPRRCSFIWPLLGALVGMPFLLWGGHLSPSFNVSAFLASWVFEWKIEWDPTYFADASSTKGTESSVKQRKRHRNDIVKRYALFALGAVVFSAIFTAAMYQHLQVDINGQHIKVKDAAADYFKPGGLTILYRQLSGVANQVWSFLRRYGVRGIWAEVWTTLNYPSEAQAFKVLNLYTGASQKEIEVQCRALARQWHPDKFRDSEQKKKAENVFISIQQACNRLSSERQRRQSINIQKHARPH